MKNCLICQTSQDLVSLNPVAVALEGAPWGKVLVCAPCVETLGGAQIKELVGIAIREKSFEPSNVILAGEPEEGPGGAEPISGHFELPISQALLSDSAAFARKVGERIGGKLWDLHRQGVSEARLQTSMTPDGEGGYVFAAQYASSHQATARQPGR